MKRLSTRLIVGSLVATMGIALAGCASTTTTSSDDVKEVTVKVGTLRGQPHFYAPFLYEDNAPAGVTFEVITLDTTPALNDALVSGAIDFAITGVTPTISSVAQDRDLVIVASAADGGSGFIGNDSIATIDDVVGKKIGYIQGSAQEIALRLTLQDHDIDPADVDLIVVPVPDMANSFKSGSIDGFFGVEIGASIALQNGGHEIVDPYETPIGKVNIGLVTTGTLIDTDPELVQEVVDTHVKTVAYMADNDEVWLKQMVNTFGGDQKVFESALKNFWMRSDLPQDYLTQLETLATEMKGLGLIPKSPDIDTLVNTTFVTAAK